MSVLIKNGHVVDPSNGKNGICDVLIEDGRIAKVEPMITQTADQVIDADGLYVVPGLIDLHVHLREPGFEYKETIKTGAAAAARGGFTSICPMPNTMPVIDSAEQILWLKDKAAKDAVINIWPVGSVTINQKGKVLADILGMAKAGAVAISEDGHSVMDAELYKEAMYLAKEAGMVVLAHCEDKKLVNGGVLNAGAVAERIGVAGIGNDVEDVITARDILLAKSTGCRLHLCHCSTEDSVKMVKLARAEGLLLSAEVCPHHFTLTQDDIPGDDANYKMNPPLRTAEDRDALIEGLCSGVMEAISTDHAPHHADEKAKGIAAAPFGIVGSETALPLALTELVHTGKMSFYDLIDRMSCRPAQIIGIDRGSLAVGKPADITLIDLNCPHEIHHGDFVSLSKNTPFDGYKAKGRAVKTIVNGNIVCEG